MIVIKILIVVSFVMCVVSFCFELMKLMKGKGQNDDTAKENDMRPVKWQKEYGGGRFPFCPYCNEYAYEKDHCVFCEKPYRWREPWRYKTRTVTVGEYTVGQASNHHVMIAKDGRMVYHASCTKRMSKRKLKGHIKLYEMLCEKESNHDGQADQPADC